MEIRLAASAVADLEEIQQHYTEQGVPEVGKRILDELVQHVGRLADHPEIGRVVPEFETPNLRELIHPPFRIVYWRESDRLDVIRIWRSERLLRLPNKT